MSGKSDVYLLLKKELSHELQVRGLSTDGTLDDLRKRFLSAVDKKVKINQEIVDELDEQEEIQLASARYSELSEAVEAMNTNDIAEMRRLKARLVHSHNRLHRQKFQDDLETKRCELVKNLYALYVMVKEATPSAVSKVFLSLVAIAASVCRNAQLLRSGIHSEEQRKGIVEHHNQLRNYVASGGVATQPSAQNMREMRWDDELAQLAQKWADGCLFEHDPKKTNRKGAFIGQNLALFTTNVKAKLDAPDFTNMVQGWFNEVYQFGYNGTFNYNSGHYSQMIWGSTFKIGCGYSGYYQKNLYHNYLVCNYYPAGNTRGSLPYEFGRRDCEEHELFSSWRYNNLCTIDKHLINSCQYWKAGDDQTTTITDSTEVTTDLPGTTNVF
ncbi:hypothetical protein GE061_002485 [Apolygus lucorum]|uniref:SCP domain-containing protein n=1 Tax=Apolygus lucorum TaxID=248454 RepID=A0A8S9X998_APOLU|nr:hypothetical protein GE061_002485 [Apolygus lucorum]